MRAFVTGGNSTLGRAIVKCFHDNGWECLYSSRDGKECVKLDYNAPFDSKKLLEDVKEIDCLVNNAGIFTEGKQEELALSEFEKVMDVNLKGLFLTTQTFLPVLKKRNGSIVNIASINAIHPGFGTTAHYDASKGAVKAYTASLAFETGLRVNAVAPGLISSDRLKGSDLESYWCGHSVKESMVAPEDIAKAVFFLATSQGIYGQTIVVDNGFLLR